MCPHWNECPISCGVRNTIKNAVSSNVYFFASLGFLSYHILHVSSCAGTTEPGGCMLILNTGCLIGSVFNASSGSSGMFL